MENARLNAGENCVVQDNCLIGLEYKIPSKPVEAGDNAVFRAGTIIYSDVTVGHYFQTGHNVLIREDTSIGDHVIIGTNTVVDGNVCIGSFVKIESNCYIPTHTQIGERVFFGPNVVLTNDKYPLKMRHAYKPVGPIIEDNVTLGAGSIILPGVRIGEGSMVAAGAVVTEDIPPGSLVVGVPGNVKPLPEELREDNMALSWRKYLNE